MTATLEVLLLEPQYRERVWGGKNIKDATPPIGEAWIVYEENVVASGRYAGTTLAELAQAAWRSVTWLGCDGVDWRPVSFIDQVA